MKHPYRISEIARQAGLSPATVDRVLHNRGGVRESTAREVYQAIADLDRKQSPGGPFPVDVVLRSSMGFATEVRRALDAELPGLLPAVVKPRFHRAQDASGVVAALSRVGRSRSQGLILTAPDTPEIAEAVSRLDLPVVTLITDLPASKRVAYVGVDHADAGATAAYLIGQWLADRAGDVLVVRDAAGAFDERAAGFRAEVSVRQPRRRLLEVVDGEVRRVLADNPSVRAVYSLLDDNTAVIGAFAEVGRNYDVFVAHDLTGENAALLRAHKLSAVLHHDLRADLRHACLAMLRAQGVLPGPIRSHPSAIQIVTPFNTPPVDL